MTLPVAAGLSGHAWTVAGAATGLLARRRLPPAQPWCMDLPDERHGSIRLTGLYHPVPGARDVVVVVHGLGGRARSAYCARAARAVLDAGASCLRLSLRGADRQGEDLYHAGLSSDLAAVLGSAEVGAHERAFVLGFSMGGHLALHLAAADGGQRPTAVGAVCPPVDLAAAAHAFDRRIAAPYRSWVLGGLKRSYRALLRRGRAPSPWDAVRGARTIRELDAVTVCPRHGFASPEDYYARASVAAHVSRLAVPALVVAAERDPMVPADTLREALAAPGHGLETWWLDRGGHVGFPRRAAAGLPTPPGRGPRRGRVEDAVVAWLLAR